MEDSNDTSSFCEDRQHLQGIPTHFASQTDLLLTVQDGTETIGFPVHKTLVSAHSPVLSEMLDSLVHKQEQTQLPRLTMMDDSCAALRSALQCIYEGYHTTEATAHPKPAPQLSTAATHISNMKFLDKYNMAKVAQMQTEAFMAPLRGLVQHTIVSEEEVAHILDCAAAAQACELELVLALCEAIIIAHYPTFALQHLLMTSKLLPPTIFRVAQGYIQLLQNAMSDMTAVMGESVDETKLFTVRMNGYIRHRTRDSEVSNCCPRCGVSLYKADFGQPLRHEDKCKCTRSCTWPNHTYTPHQVDMKKILQDIAVTHNVSLNAIGVL